MGAIGPMLASMLGPDASFCLSEFARSISHHDVRLSINCIEKLFESSNLSTHA
jgi:hypothetical protein